MAQLTIYLDDALLEDVRKRAKESGKSVSAVVADAAQKLGIEKLLWDS